MDNARIHRTDKIVKMIKEHKLVVFTIPPYSPELNKIENTFGRLKNRISFQNLNSKDFKHVIVEEIRKLYRIRRCPVPPPLSSPPCKFGGISVFEKIFNKKNFVKNYAFELTVNKIFLFLLDFPI